MVRVFVNHYLESQEVKNSIPIDYDRMIQIDDPNVIRYQKIVISNDDIRLIRPYIVGDSLLSVICAKGPFPKKTWLRIADLIATSIESFHSNGIACCSLNPNNIIISIEGKIYLVDMGLRVIFIDSHKTNAEDCLIRGPEYISPPSDPTFALDIWNFGLILHLMLLGELPWSPRNFVRLLTEMNKDPKLFNGSIPQDIQDLLSKMLHSKPEMRPTIQEVRRIINIIKENDSSSPVPESIPIRRVNKVFFPTTDFRKTKVCWRIHTSQSFGSKLELTKCSRQSKSLDFTESTARKVI